MEAAKQQAIISRDDLLDMLSRLSELYRRSGETEIARNYAALTKTVYETFAEKTDVMKFSGREPVWLNETIWPRLGE